MQTKEYCIYYQLTVYADSHRELSRQFHDREVSKEYTASLWGHLPQTEGEVNLPLMTDWPNRPRQMVSEEGKPALTKYHLIAEEQHGSRVKLIPITGRSHQLRVHMLSLGNPIIGDRLYAPEEAITVADRLLLHASYLALVQPSTGERLEFRNAANF